MDDRLVDERLRLSTAREQLETARTREEELLNELQILHASQVVTEMGQITEGDVNDLKAAFKKDLEDVLGFVREFSQPTAAQEETAETALEESGRRRWPRTSATFASCRPPSMPLEQAAEEAPRESGGDRHVAVKGRPGDGGDLPPVRGLHLPRFEGVHDVLFGPSEGRREPRAYGIV